MRAQEVTELGKEGEGIATFRDDGSQEATDTDPWEPGARLGKRGGGRMPGVGGSPAYCWRKQTEGHVGNVSKGPLGGH